MWRMFTTNSNTDRHNNTVSNPCFNSNTYRYSAYNSDSNTYYHRYTP
jgi:hypothetical protein